VAAPDVFRAVADPTRRRMIELLRRSDLSVSDLARPFRMSQPGISQHLDVLRAVGLVRRRREGRRHIYRLERGPLGTVYNWVARQLARSSGRAGPTGRGKR
jgi:DNA-binding transcriptional ArsR family regulator